MLCKHCDIVLLSLFVRDRINPSHTMFGRRFTKPTQSRRTSPKPSQRKALGNICVILRFQQGFGCVAERKRYKDRFFKSKSVLLRALRKGTNKMWTQPLLERESDSYTRHCPSLQASSEATLSCLGFGLQSTIRHSF